MFPRALLISLVIALPLTAGAATAHAAPLNDNRAQSALVAAGGQTLSGSNIGATVESIGAEYNKPGAGNRSVWYRWTPNAAGLVTVEVSSSSFDPVVAAFPEEWDVPFRENLDISAGDDDARISFYAKAGHQYDLLVDGQAPGASGMFTIDVDHDTTPPPPANDSFSSPKALVGQNVWAEFNTVFATGQLNEPTHRGQTDDHSVWFSWTAPASGGVNVRNECHDSDPWDMYIDEPVLAVYTGSLLATLTHVVPTQSNLDPDCPHGSVQFQAVAGTTYRIAAASLAGHDEGHLFLTQDSTPPQTTIGIPSVTGTKVKLAVSADGATKFECLLDGKVVAGCPGATVGPLSAGSHAFKVRATDYHGNVETSWKTKIFTVDATPAETQITSGPAAVSPQFKDIQVAFGSEPGATFKCAYDAGQSFPCTSPSKIPTAGDGEHQLKVWATDPYGNEDPTPAVHAWRIDSKAPHIDWYAVPNGVAPNKAFSITFKVSEPAATECALDGAPLQPCSTPHEVPGGVPAAGDHTFRVRAVDAAGNVGERSVTFRSTAPYVPPARPATTTGTTARPTGTTGTGTTAPRLIAGVPGVIRRSVLLRRGVQVRVTTGGPTPVRLRLTAGRKVLVQVHRGVGRSATFTLRLGKAARSWLRRHPGVRRLQLRVDGGGVATTRVIRLR